MVQLGATFSILGRIGGDATFCSPAGGLMIRPFQYPRPDRRRCNVLLRQRVFTCCSFQYPRPDRRRCNIFGDWAKSAELSFQYPRSDRRRCNVVSPAPGGALRASAFSILGRIGGDATLLAIAHLLKRGYPFSILGRIGGDATAIRYPQ